VELAAVDFLSRGAVALGTGIGHNVLQCWRARL
jgi:hypothetical protein